jgi:lipopolysaccharide biosynthesis glycosyltransferase
VTSILLAADERYLPYVVCSIDQLAWFGRRADGITLVVPASASEEDLAGPRTAAEAYGLELEVVAVSGLTRPREDGLLFDNGYISHFTYAKLLLPETLPNLDDVLYLDVDTVIRGPLDDLLGWDLRHPLGAVEELAQNSLRMFGTNRVPYFNAGVLRMSLERMRAERVWEQAYEILLNRPGLRFQDQDILNLVFRGRFDILPGTWNVFDSLARTNPNLWAMRDPTIVHFAGPVKPWHCNADSRFAREWRRHYAAASRAGTSRGRDGAPADVVERGAAAAGRSRRVLPAPARRAARSLAVRAVGRAIGRLEETRTALELGRRWQANLDVTLDAEAARGPDLPPGGGLR